MHYETLNTYNKEIISENNEFANEKLFLSFMPVNYL